MIQCQVTYFVGKIYMLNLYSPVPTNVYECKYCYTLKATKQTNLIYVKCDLKCYIRLVPQY